MAMPLQAGLMYQPPAGGGGGDPDADAYIAALVSEGITVSPTDNAIIQTAFLSLKGNYGFSDVWGKRKVWYPVYSGVAAGHKYNAFDPRDLDAAFRLTFSGSITHSATGMAFDGITGYADSHFVPFAQFMTNNGYIGYYSRTSGSNGGFDFCATNGSGANQNTGVICYYSSTAYAVYGSNTYACSANPGDGLALTAMNRTGGDTELWRRGSMLAVAAEAVFLPSYSLTLGAANQAGGPVLFSGRECAGAYIFESLTSTECADVDTIMQNFNTSLSRNV